MNGLRTVEIDTGDAVVEAGLAGTADAAGIVVFAHGSGSSRHSPRNQQVAARLRQEGLATLLMDLLTSGEDALDRRTREHRFDIGLLARRLRGATQWLATRDDTRRLGVGYFGASTGAAAALVAAADHPAGVQAVVSRGGRPDLADEWLPHVEAPTLLIVGGDDRTVLGMNERARTALTCDVALEVVPGASHLFEELGALEQVGDLAAGWFADHLRRRD